jgi:hypothetical protein
MSDNVRFFMDRVENSIINSVIIRPKLSLNTLNEQHLEVRLVYVFNCPIVLVVMNLVNQLIAVNIGTFPFLVK